MSLIQKILVGFFYILFSLFITFEVVSQNGPGGKGSTDGSSELVLWLSANDITGLNNGNSLTSWSDLSGYNRNVTDANIFPANTPVFIDTASNNGKTFSAVTFDGLDDYYQNTYSYDARTVFIVYRYENPTSQNNTDLGQLWGDYDNQVHVAIDNRAGGNFGGFSFDGASPPSTTARYGLNSAAYGGSVAASGSNTVDTIGFNIVAAEFNSAISLDEQILGALIPGDASLNIANHNYQGEIAEIIVFDVTLNDAERLSVENYLSTKYSIDISGAGNDFYAFDATHEFEVAGIGRVGLAYDTASFSSPVLGLDTLGNTIDDGDFAFLGHDNGGLAWTRTEEPTAGLSNIRRTTREWRVDETNTFSAVRVLVDTTQLGAPPAGYNKYVLLVDTDGDFANAQVFEMFQLSGTPYWQIEYDFDDGDHISIGVVRPVIGFSSATLSDFETVTSPTITVSTNYIVSSNTTVNYVTSDAGATAGVDYTGISLTTGTITAGTSSFSIPLSISNDMDSETAENLNITLSNIPAGINALNNPLVYTIEDDDNPRKIFFDQPSATISEATSSIDVVVNITPSQVDPLNSTTVDYAVTGLSTATGAGTDYTLAAGTLTIAANNISNSFNIAINDDALSENTETIVVELSNPTNGNLSLTDPTTYTLSITDNDPAPTVQFNVVASSNVESLTNPSIFVVLSTASGEDVSVDYTISGTATGGGTDFTLVNGTATITAGGDVFTTINPTINSDSDPEADETIIITLSNPSGASLGTNTTHTYTITNDDGPFGFQGPGGVGGSNTLSIWLKADSLSGLSDGASISNWPDISGNDRDATQGNPTYQPTWENGGGDQINGFPVIRFDGIDDHTDDALAYNAKTVFIVFRASSTAQDNGELAHIWGSYNELVHIAPEPRAGGDQFGYSLDGNQSGTGTARYGQNGEDYGLLVDDGTYYTWSYDQVFLVTVEYDETKALTRQTLGGIVDQFAVGAQHFGGDLGEIIVFNQELSAARRNIVENYLSGKYGISLPSAKDLYAYDGSHPYDITGVGQDAAGKAHTDAVSNNILRVTTSGLDNEEYLFFGHDNASLNWSSVEVPSDSLQRIAREWRLDETGETGNLTIAIDTSYLTAKPTDYQGYVLLLDDDGNFSNGGTTINSLVQNGAYYEVTDINPTDGSFATIATVGITAHVGISAISVAEDIGTYNLEVNLSRASASATDISFSVDVSSTATEGGGNDFTVVASPETILAGNTSVNVVLTINNDALIELDETVIVNLSSATNNVAIRQDSVFTLTIQDDDASNATGTGPGGVQVPSDYTFWLQADSEVYSDEPPTTLANDGNAIAYWEDLSTNGNQADSIGSFSPPNYRNNVSANRNGKPVIDFSGGDLLMSIANANEINVLASSEKTIIIAFQTGTDINNLQVIYEQGGGSNGLNMHIENGTLYIAAWDNDWTGTYLDHTSPIAANTSYIAALELDAANTTFQAYLNTVSLGTTSILGGQTDLDGHAGLVGIGGMYNASYFNGATADESGENYFFDGQIFEIIKTHNDNLNTAQRVIIENYLAGKWNINISSGTDIYSHKTSHSYHVAGIGQSVSGEFNLAAQSTGFVTISNPTGLDDGDYLLFGHDNADTSAYVGTEVPDVNFQRLAREWRVSEQGNIDGVKFTFDTTAIIATPGADFNEYALLVDSDGDFSSGATVYTMTQNGGSFEVSGVNLSDGDYFTFAAFRPVIQFVPATVNGGEGASPVSAIVALNYPLSTAISVDFALNVGNSSATRGPSDDFNFSDGTLNIAAGDTTASVSIVVLDDVAIEGNEDIEIDLSNPSPGLFIGNDTTFTYTIEDNDISTQIDFSVTTSNIGEDAGSANVTVKLNQIDASDVNVDYTVTAGSASGSGEDYTLANGTATITAGNLSANIQLSIIDDATFENTETVEITLSNPVNASLGSNTVHTLSINDNDSAPDISFSTATANGSEGSTPANIPVILSAVSGLDATVDYEVVLANTSASSGSDYTLSNGSVTIPAGSSQTAISIAIIDDLNLEVDENIQLRLFDNGNLANANIGGADTINFSINDNDASGFTGPGGVRSSSDYLYWLRADKTIYNDTTSNTIASNNQIAQGWVDFSGNGNDAFGNSGSEPVYKNNVSDNVNQKPILDFSSGSAEMTMFNADDINDVGPYNNKTIVAAFQVGTETADRQVVYEQGGDTNGFAIYIYEDSVFLAVWENIGTGSNETFDSLSAPISAGQSVVALIDYDAGSLAFNGFINGVSQGTKAVVADGIPSHGGDISIGGSDAGLAIHGTGGLGFRGKIFELLSFNGNYSTTQRVILENYLAAKYNADISSGGNDYYGYSGTHSYGVAGIGRVSSSDFKTITQSDAMITISNASSLDDSDYLIFGHNNASVNVYTTTEAPTGIQRLEREWRVSETGELGTISFSIDTTSFGVAPSAGFTERVLLIDTDGDFTTGATIVPLSRNGSAYEASGVDFGNGDYFTFAVIRPEVQFTQASSNSSESLSPAQIEISLNYALGQDLAVNVTQTGGSATKDVDFAFTDGNRTISAGSTTVFAEVDVTNDAEVESDETVTLTLSSPTLGSLGTNTTHTFSINDDDNFRKANFSKSDSTDTEDQTVQGVFVFLNAPDNVNPTEVYIEVTGGTAQNDSIDFYIQARDTVTFAASDTVEFFPINVIDDMLDEDDETVTISIVGGSNTTVGDTAIFTLTIQDNDLPPAVQFVSTTQSGDESFQTVNLAVELSTVSGKDVTLSYGAIGGTATVNNDYQFNNTTTVIPAGSTTSNFQFTVINDALNEVPDETIIFQLNDPSPNASLGANDSTTYAILDNDGAGYEGPGGVGNLTEQTTLWVRSDDATSGFSNGATVATWQDQTANNNDVFQNTASSRPLFTENILNNRPGLVFDGIDDVLTMNDAEEINTGGPYDSKTIFLAFRTSADINTRQMLYEEGGGIRGLSIYILNGTLFIGGWNANDDDGGATTPWPQSTPPYTINVQRAIATNTNYFVVLQYDFDVAGAGFNGDVRASLNGETLQELTGAGRLFAHGDDIGIGGVVGTTVYHDLNSSEGPDYFTGSLGELIVTNIVYNEAQRRIVYNYLAAKYDIDIAGEDVFAYEATHGYDIVGIGRTDAANPHNDAQGTGVVRINNPSDLGDNEFLLIGHDDADLTTWSSTEVPNNNSNDFRRLAREWRADETGDVGNITMTLSPGTLASPPAGFPANYVLLVDADGDFTSGASIYQLTDGGGTFTVNDIDLSGDQFFTIGIAKGTVEFSLTASNSLEDDSPDTVEVTLNYVAGQTATVDYTVTEGTAFGSGVDFTLADGTLTFNTGQQTQDLIVNLTNDALAENDEQFTITLSNPSAGLALGANTTHTYTINDSDQTRKVNFAKSDSTDLEDQTPILIDVFISEQDPIDTMRVFYAVSGTATNAAMGDFQLDTPDTLVFLPTDTLESISIPINDDAIDELDETIILTITSAANAGLGDTLVFTYTIQDNDTAPTLSFDAASSSGSEGSTNVSIPISLSGPSAQDISFDYSVNLSSTATGGGGDYNIVGSSRTILAGQTSTSIDFTLFNDDISELDETIIINLSNPVNTTFGSFQDHTFTVIDDDGGLGPLGPGGVGKTQLGSEMVFWLRADHQVFNEPTGTTPATNGDNVFFWADQSGLGNNAYDTTGSTSGPDYIVNAVNDKPAIDFAASNSNDLLMDNSDLINTDVNDYTLKTIGLVFRTSADITSRQVIYEQGGAGNGMNVWVQSGVLHFGAWSTNNGWDYIEVTTTVTTNEVVSAIFELDQASSEIRARGYRSTGGAFNGNTGGVTAPLHDHAGLVGIGATRNDTKFSVSVTTTGEGDYFDGEILELFQFNERNPNSFAQKLIYSYYEGKYGIAVSDSYDIYNDLKDGTHAHDIFGIGQDSAAARHLVSRSPDEFIQIDNAAGITDGEYLLIGHDSAATNAYSNTELIMSLSSFVQRLDREWTVEESGDIGNFRMRIDTTMLPANPAGYEEFFIILDNDGDGDFTDASDGDLTFYRLYDRYGSWALTDTLDLAEGDVFTVGMATNVSVNDGVWSDPNTWLLGVPQPDEPALLRSTVTLDQNITASQVIGLDNATSSLRGRLNLSTYTLTVTDSLILLGYGLPTQDLTTFDAGTGTIDYQSSGEDIFIQPLMYHNLTLSGSGRRHLRSETTVENNFTINNNPCLVLDGNNLNIQGDWNNSIGSQFEFGSATVQFNGTANDQTISSTNSKVTFNRIVVNKPGGRLILGDTVEVSSELQMTNSNIRLGNEVLIIGSNAPTALAGNGSSFIEADGNGYVEWAIAAGNSYVYPVGDVSGNYTPITFEPSAITSSGTPCLQLNLVASRNADVSDQAEHLARYWTITPKEISSATYDITMAYNQSDFIGTDESLLVPIKFSVDADTSDFPNFTLDTLNNTLLWQDLTSFSIVTSGVASSTLPVELLHFEGQLAGPQVLLTWSTATEIDNDYFEVQRSFDGLSFETIGEVDGNGNTTDIQEYSFIDTNPAVGIINFYRLRQVDFDGAFEFSYVITVGSQVEDKKLEALIFPNPARGENVNIEISPADNYPMEVRIISMTGIEVLHQIFAVGQLTASMRLELEQELSSGLYLVAIRQGEEHLMMKLVVKN